MVLTELASIKIKITSLILSINTPFKISQLYSIMKQHNIIDKELILDTLGNLYEHGLINYASTEDNTAMYVKA